MGLEKIEQLLEKNRNWADSIKEKNPDFFKQLVHQQKPDYLWIGCSDSRVPETQILGLMPGDVFVHRNIANLVVHSDLSSLSVLFYAVNVLKVKHIIVCGHYGCGGVMAALSDQEHGLIDNWLNHIKDVKRLNASKFTKLDEEAQVNLLVELNVRKQIENICNSSIVKSAWKNGANLSVHGLVYNFEDGLLKELVSHEPS